MSFPGPYRRGAHFHFTDLNQDGQGYQVVFAAGVNPNGAIIRTIVSTRSLDIGSNCIVGVRTSDSVRMWIGDLLYQTPPVILIPPGLGVDVSWQDVGAGNNHLHITYDLL